MVDLFNFHLLFLYKILYMSGTKYIATATINRADVLVSWNFKHIVNLERIHRYNAVNLKLGYPMIEIRTPTEVLNYEI